MLKEFLLAGSEDGINSYRVSQQFDMPQKLGYSTLLILSHMSKVLPQVLLKTTDKVRDHCNR
jgi:hypothetical protein